MKKVSNHKKSGDEGEAFAVSYLTEDGYKIIEKNYRTFLRGEIDIIAQDRQYLCFVEVKTRASSKFGCPQEAVTRLKQKKLVKLAQAYINDKQLKEPKVRFDVVAVTLGEGIPRRAEIIKNAFEGDV